MIIGVSSVYSRSSSPTRARMSMAGTTTPRRLIMPTTPRPSVGRRRRPRSAGSPERPRSAAVALLAKRRRRTAALDPRRHAALHCTTRLIRATAPPADGAPARLARSSRGLISVGTSGRDRSSSALTVHRPDLLRADPTRSSDACRPRRQRLSSSAREHRGRSRANRLGERQHLEDAGGTRKPLLPQLGHPVPLVA